ncbi:MAG: DUF2339 domain-containing protein [Patescibacteria group bacterium]
MELFILIIGALIIWSIIRLYGRVNKLEKLVMRDMTKEYTKGENVASIPQAVQTPTPTEPTQVEELRQLQPNHFFEWLKKDWLLKVGALLLLIGFGWLVTYAFLNNWIGPMGRIVIGIVAGALILLFGWLRMRKYISQGAIFLVLGSTVILLTTFAAREIYEFFTPLIALVVMFLSTAFIALASVRYKTRTLALASLVLAGVAPLLTNSASLDYVGLFSYLFVVTLGTIWIVVLTGWRALTTAALILITFYSLPHLFSFTTVSRSTLFFFAYAFAALFFITNTVGIIKLKGREITADLVTAAGNGLFLLAWIMTSAQDEWKSLIIAAWMVIFSIGAFLIFIITNRREPFYVYAGVSIAMLAAATAAELNGATLTLAYTIESGMIAVISYAILHDIKVAERTSFLLLGPMLLSFASMEAKAWRTGVLHENFFVLLILALTILGLGLIFRTFAKRETEPRVSISTALLVTGSIYLYIILWLSLHAGLTNYDFATMIALVMYTIIALITHVAGKIKEKKSLRLYGAILLGFVILRLFTVDVWDMELTGKIITFFAVGILLMSTAFINRKKESPQLTNSNS